MAKDPTPGPPQEAPAHLPEKPQELPQITRDALDKLKQRIESDKEAFKGRAFDLNGALKNIQEAAMISDEQFKQYEPLIRKELIKFLKEAGVPVDPKDTKEFDDLNKASTGVEQLTKAGDKAKDTIENLRKKYPGLSWIWPWIGAYFYSMAEKAKKDNKPTIMSGLYEKMAGWFGYETPKDKFNKFKSGIKLPQGFTLSGDYKDAKEIELKILKTTGEQTGTIKYNTENGEITLVTTKGTFVSKDIAEINKHLASDKLQAAAPTAAPGQTPAPGAAPAPAPAPGPAAPEQQETPAAKYTRLFDAKGWKLDTQNLAQDLQKLKNGGITEDKIEEEINNAAVKGSNLNKFYEAIRSVLPDDKVFKLRLTDLLCKNIHTNIVEKGVAVIKSKKDKTPEQIRKFVDDSFVAKDDLLALKKIADAYKA